MSKVNLPKLPKGKEFEEYISAIIQCAGLYVELNIIDRQEEGVLELDIITTDYKLHKPPVLSLFEVKSGNWGYGDIFKIRGWLDYLELETGHLVAKQERKQSPETCGNVLEKIGIGIIPVPDLHNTEKLASVLPKLNINKTDIASWRFSYWTERKLLRKLTAKKKSLQDKKAYRALDEYFCLLNNKIFFTSNIVQRVEELYSIFQQFPNVSAKLGHELQGEDFEESYESVPNELYRRTYYNGELTDLAISTFIEHRARLAILKSATDFLLKKIGDEKDNFRDTLWVLPLPQSFQDGLYEIARHKYFYRYPVFWQWFLWVFGGFILKDYEQQEMEVLSEKTGVPTDEIPNAFKAYEILFPLKDGWFLDLQPNSKIKMMRMFPVPFMGIGVNYRRWIYTEEREIDKLQVTGQYTLSDLSKWNKVLVSLLE